jgi:S-adenosylmethionine synthetase
MAYLFTSESLRSEDTLDKIADQISDALITILGINSKIACEHWWQPDK